VRGIIEKQEGVRFDRAHFKEFGDWALNFEVVYWMLDPDYGRYMDVRQAINLALVDALAAAGVAFAYPTQNLIVAGPLKLEGKAEESAVQAAAAPLS